MALLVAPQFALKRQVAETRFGKQDNSVIMVTNLAVKRVV
jgi:hypothetical protein